MDDIPLVAQFVALAVLLVVSGFFSMAETGMMAINRYRLRALERAGNRGARLAAELLRQTDRLLSMLLAGNTLVNAVITMLVGVITIRLFGNDKIVLGVATVAVAFLILVFAEITPKVIGARFPEQTALAASYVLKPLVKGFSWTLWIANIFVRGLLWLLRIPIDPGPQRLSME
ncbi:MAG TPA: CNNM domain-containing protein, partial [Burkholderiales bacterium]|nr:CNNM domain-containing protein [Burkholderiales bacterium]